MRTPDPLQAKPYQGRQANAGVPVIVPAGSWLRERMRRRKSYVEQADQARSLRFQFGIPTKFAGPRYQAT
jgi:hypothetical protein